MEDTDFDLLCIGLSADEAKRLRKVLAEWSDGDENGFPVQLAMLTRAQWRAAALIPHTIKESGKLIESHLAACRLETAVIVGNLSAATRDNSIEMKKIIKAHAESVNQASVLVRNQLWETMEITKQIREKLDEGVAASNRARSNLEAGSERFQQSCRELDERLTLRELRRDWLTLLGLIAIGTMITN